MQQQFLLKNPYETYQEQGVLTAGPMELILMLYNGLRKNMILARRAMEQQDLANAHNRLMKAQSIINELINSLDMSFAVSADLLAIYEFMMRQLVEVNVTKNSASIEPLLEIAEILRDAWQQVNNMQKGGLYEEEGEL
ncbi:MAG: flagellar export chaperone FliS [Firmicutes bacterium]|nr:flagellar export chaperone FliS [Bacillota bacterium]